jgi:tRNA-dihydrouridine synthase B
LQSAELNRLMKIGAVQLKNPYIFAPIAGYSDVGFRALCARYGAGLTVTEMVSAKAVNFGNKNCRPLLAVAGDAAPAAVQLFGSDPEDIYKALLNPLFEKFDIIDINMGCPVRKVVSNGEGCALMKSPALIEEIIGAATLAAKRPVTCKLRAGYYADKPNVVECAAAAERGGASAVAVHPRFREQYYSGAADMDLVAEVKRAVKIPVIANGDIKSKADVERVKEQTGCDGVMIGRAALGRPWIFSEIAGKTYVLDIKSDILRHIEILKTVYPDRVVANNMKTHLCYYAKNLSNPKAVRAAATSVKSLEQLIAVVDQFF